VSRPTPTVSPAVLVGAVGQSVNNNAFVRQGFALGDAKMAMIPAQRGGNGGQLRANGV
jgi:hypothetical protein